MSTENRKKRPPEELDFLFNMYKTCGNLLNDFLMEQKINFRWI
jgi:undecaprenyl pyrophosphate synthase